MQCTVISFDLIRRADMLENEPMKWGVFIIVLIMTFNLFKSPLYCSVLCSCCSNISSGVCVLFAGMDGDPDLNFLLKGAELVKVRSGSWRKVRFYKLQEDCKTVWHESKKTLRPKHTCESIPHTCTQRNDRCWNNTYSVYTSPAGASL